MEQPTEDSIRPFLGLPPFTFLPIFLVSWNTFHGDSHPTTRNKGLPQGTSDSGLCWCGKRLTIIAVLYVLRIRCSMAGISWDAGRDGKVLSMPSAIVTRVGKRVAIMFGRTSAFWRNLRVDRSDMEDNTIKHVPERSNALECGYNTSSYLSRISTPQEPFKRDHQRSGKS
jgi:hypothetical protein